MVLRTHHSWVDPIVPDEEDRCRFLRYKFVNGQLLKHLDVYDGADLVTTYAFQEEEGVAPQVGDECLRIDYVIVVGDKKSIECSIVTVTQEMIDDTAAQANLAPTDIALSNNVIDNNTPIGAIVGTLSTFDPNIGDSHTYIITADPDNKFTISGDKLRTTALMSGAAHTHLVTIRSTDQGALFYEKEFTIFVAASVDFTNEKATLFQDDTVARGMVGPASSTILPGAGSFTMSTWVKKDNPAFQNDFAIALNGSNGHMAVANPSNFHFSNGSNDLPFTFSMWAKITGTNKVRLMIKGDTTSREVLFILDGTDKLTLLMYTDAANTIRQQTTATMTPHIGVWTHYAVTYDGSETSGGIKLYINGAPETQVAIPTGTYTGIVDSGDPLEFGRFNGQDYGLAYDADEAVVWNKELSAGEMASLYNNGKAKDLTPQAADIVSWWRMGDGDTSPTILDQVGSNHGTLVNTSIVASTLDGANATVTLPNDISGLDVWLDADDSASIILNSGKISQWRDRSGNNNHASQTVDASRPTVTTNGYGTKNTIDFDATGFLETTYDTNEDTTIFTVFAHDQTTVQPAGPLWQTDSTTATSGFFPRWTDLAQYVAVDGTYMTKSSIFAQNTFYNTAVVYNTTGNVTELYSDGVLDDTQATAQPAGTDFLIGRRETSDNNYVGQIAEIIIYNRVLTPTERQQVDDYLNAKWNLGQIVEGFKSLVVLHQDAPALDAKAELRWNESNKLEFQYFNGATSSKITATGDFGDNIYHNIAARYNSIVNSVELYVDGVSLASTTDNIVTTGTGLARIASFDGENRLYDGLMDEVSIWNEAIDMAELYNLGFAQNLLDNLSLTGLKLWLRMGDSPDDYFAVDGIKDRSVNANHFTALSMTNSNCVSDSVLVELPYVNEKSLESNGIDQYIDTNLSTDLSGTGDFTISMWYKGTSPNYLAAQAHTTPGYSSDWIFGGGGAIFWMRTKTLGSLATISDNQWHHVVMVWDATALTYEGFVDGVSIGTSAAVSGFGGVGTIKIATRGDATTSFNTGLTDEFSIWAGTKLNATEIGEIYNAGIPIDLLDHSTAGSLTLWYRMGEDTGDNTTTVIDQNGISDGTLQNYITDPYVTDVPT